MSIIYHFNRHGILVNEGPARLCPKSGCVLVPRNATTLKPPELVDGMQHVFNITSSSWIATEDHTGVNMYNKESKEKTTVDFLGPIPDSCTLLPPPEDGYYIWDDAWVEDMEFTLEVKKNRLWRTAKDYEEAGIDGSAILMLNEVTTETIAVKQWIKTIWNVYYVKQGDLVSGNEYTLDFSGVGKIPYTVRELTELLA